MGKPRVRAGLFQARSAWHGAEGLAFDIGYNRWFGGDLLGANGGVYLAVSVGIAVL